ncbi:hypothetical protein F4775DRAFT_571183 [Biscogniauxia sp. FL1348]|nr:hypothetical protein F4775DRAFT_571183 [Biscogniauxia sp. FL1348]
MKCRYISTNFWTFTWSTITILYTVATSSLSYMGSHLLKYNILLIGLSIEVYVLPSLPSLPGNSIT